MSLTISTNSNASYAGFNSMPLQQSLSRLLSGKHNCRASNDAAGLTVSYRLGNPINRLKSDPGKMREGNFFMKSPHALRSQANTSSSAVLMLTH